jgi:cyclopropane fatty-acyl-phospholipid synthase-like methyltransferase
LRGIDMWNERFASPEYVFGTEPNAFVVRQAARITPGMKVLAVADGEGRNGVWLARQGAEVLSVDGSPIALAKARALAERHRVALTTECADLTRWDWGRERFDAVVAIFIQFTGPAERAAMFANIARCLAPGGLLLLHGYRVEQLNYGTGGPNIVENLYTEAILREGFADFEVLELNAYDAAVEEGHGHRGMSALIDLVARKPR